MEKVEKQIKIRRYHICGKMEKNGDSYSNLNYFLCI